MDTVSGTALGYQGRIKKVASILRRNPIVVLR
jgi:hypothetical protein